MEEILKYEKDKNDYYSILGCSPTSSTEQIICEYKNRALLLHPDKHEDTGDNQDNRHHKQELFKNIVKAKDILTDSQSRKLYDKWRNSGIAIPFDKWTQMGKDVHISMHWINKSDRHLMLENGEQPSLYNSSQLYFEPKSVEKRFWDNSYNNQMIAKFRNYQI